MSLGVALRNQEPVIMYNITSKRKINEAFDLTYKLNNLEYLIYYVIMRLGVALRNQEPVIM